MKLYNINPQEKEFSWGKMSVVVLGENGRGRMQTFIPFQATFVEGNSYEIGLTKSGKPKIVTSLAPSNGWIAHLSANGLYTRGTQGKVFVLNEDKNKIKVIAYGYGAFGEAGRIGDWDDFLVIINPEYPVRLRIRPAGGPDKSPRYWLVFTQEEAFKVRNSEVDTFIESTGISLPSMEEIKNNDNLLVDLKKLL